MFSKHEVIIQGILKATGIQNFRKSLIDLINFSNIVNKVLSGVIISDISDNFSHLFAPVPTAPNRACMHKNSFLCGV
jgi:hypothetical protein